MKVAPFCVTWVAVLQIFLLYRILPVVMLNGIVCLPNFGFPGSGRIGARAVRIAPLRSLRSYNCLQLWARIWPAAVLKMDDSA